MKNISRQKLIILITVLIDVIGIGIIIPVMPYFVQTVGASATTITFLFAVFSFCSFISAPLLGSLSDKFGRRPALIVSLFSTAVGWFVFGSAKSVAFLFLGRIIDGMAAGNFPIAQSYVADISKDDKERTANMGLIGAVFGIGFIIGPALGSFLSHVSISFPFHFVGVLAFVNTVAAYLFLPETNLNKHKDKKISVNPLHPIIQAYKDKILRVRYLVIFLFGLAVAVQQSIFALFLQYAFNFQASDSGYMMTAVGAIMVINQMVLLNKFWLKRFKESWLEVWLFLLFAISYFAMAVINLFVFGLAILFMALTQSVLRAVMSSRITGLSDQNKKGEIAGIMSALMTLGMIIGPIFIGSIYEYNPHLPFIISGVIMFVAFVIMLWNEKKTKEKGYHHKDTEPIEVVA